MIKYGEKTTAYLPLSKDIIGVDNINIQAKENRLILVAHSEATSEVKVLIDILNDETIEGCIVDYSDTLGYQSQVGGIMYVDDYVRKNGVVVFFSSEGWDPDFDDIITVQHELDVDYNEAALEKAKIYADEDMDADQIYSQLEYEQFTSDQIQYAIDHLNN